MVFCGIAVVMIGWCFAGGGPLARCDEMGVHAVEAADMVTNAAR